MLENSLVTNLKFFWTHFNKRHHNKGAICLQIHGHDVNDELEISEAFKDFLKSLPIIVPTPQLITKLILTLLA